MNTFRKRHTKDFSVPMIADFVKRPKQYGDSLGEVILYGDNFYKAVTLKGASHIKKCIDNGFVAELQDRKFIPETKIVPLELPGYAFVLQHEKIKNVSYVFEWSFSMLKDAALMVLDLADFLVSRGMCSIDAHPYNILFKNNRPIWVDLTSFVEMKSFRYAPAIVFFSTIFQPLELMAINPALARERLVHNSKMLVPKILYLNLMTKFGFQRQKYFPAAVRRYTNLFKRLGSKTDKVLICRDIEIMRQKIKKLELNVPDFWSATQNNLIEDNRRVLLFEGKFRFHKVAGMIESLPIKSVVNFMSRQEPFLAMLAEIPAIEKIVAIDKDEQAVDNLYKQLSQNLMSENCVRKIFPMVADFIIDNHPIDLESLSERIKGDALIALSMTNNLLLRQHVKIDNMFQSFSRLTKRFIFVEFMPAGLWDGIHPAIPRPPWYTEEYFVQSMEKYFRVLLKMPINKHHILFVGELKHHD